MLRVNVQSVMLLYRYAKYYAECHNAKCHNAECHYAEGQYTECHYTKCHGAVNDCHKKCIKSSLDLS